MSYSHLLSPIKIGHVYLKNRLVSSTSMPHYIQGPERFPAASMITHVANRAKGGAGVVTCTGFDDPTKVPPMEDIVHFPIIDQYDTRSQNYISQMVDAIHFYGAKASCAIMPSAIPGVDVVETLVPPFLLPPDSPPQKNRQVTRQELEELADRYAEQAVIFQKCGFDMVSVHFAYQGPLGARFLSRELNTRTDEFGGSAENRARFPLMVFRKIREACGPQLLIEALISGEDPDPSAGTTLDDAVRFARCWEGYVDILQLRAPGLDPNHPTSFCLEETPWLRYARYVKEAGVKMAVETVAGYTDLDTCERVIAQGDADLIAGARAWISNPNFGELAYQGRGGDVVPCLRCNKCHVNTIHGPYLSVCSVNPEIGLEHRLKELTAPPAAVRRVAVAGGGPAGMEAALIAAGRGHQVTLYEAAEQLGGQTIPGSVPDFKWTLKKFRDFLARKTMQHPNIRVLLSTPATPELLAGEGYDHVVVAIGAEPVVPPIPGSRQAHVMTAVDALNRPEAVTGRVAVIGGGEIGVETGMFLAKRGHQVTVLELRDKLAADATPIHYYTMFQEAWEAVEGFTGVVSARVSEIRPASVVYTDGQGRSRELPADTVVVAAGTRSRLDEALAFHGSADQVLITGDAERVGSLQTGNRSALGKVVQL